MPAPVSGGHVTQEFGVPGDYAAGYHTGRDWAGGNGNIVATRAGKVTKAAWDGDYGYRVEILTEGIEHSYSHMADLAVFVGQQVEQGHYLGEMGSTGNSTAPHCHYEERYGGFSYNEHREPQWDKDSGASSPEPPPAAVVEEEDMFIMKSPNRGHTLLAAGYEKGLTEEELHVLLDCGIRVVEHNDRGFDVARAAMMHGDAVD